MYQIASFQNLPAGSLLQLFYSTLVCCYPLAMFLAEHRSWLCLSCTPMLEHWEAQQHSAGGGKPGSTCWPGYFLRCLRGRTCPTTLLSRDAFLFIIISLDLHSVITFPFVELVHMPSHLGLFPSPFPGPLLPLPKSPSHLHRVHLPASSHLIFPALYA